MVRSSVAGEPGKSELFRRVTLPSDTQGLHARRGKARIECGGNKDHRTVDYSGSDDADC